MAVTLPDFVRIQLLWAMLRDQVTSDNNVIEIDGLVHGCLNDDALDWIADQLR